MELWRKRLERRLKLQQSPAALEEYCRIEKKLRNKIASASSLEERERTYKELRIHLGISELSVS